LHRQLREHIDVILIPLKYHITESGKITSPCKIDNCKKRHAILVYSVNANNFLYQDKKLVVLNPNEIGKLYDSNEIVLDDFEIKKEDKPKKRMVNKKSVRKSKDKLMALPLDEQLKYLNEVREDF
jgi:ABC-type bacteriocin/lantibiotic exporter with double-glycine peptidase domain